MSTWYTRDCGHQSLKDAWKNGPSEPLPGICEDCKNSRLGETIEFVRYGRPPVVSRNHRDGYFEEGVSVYELVNGDPLLVGWYYDFLVRDEYRGQGRIVGWGSDGEPLVKIIKIRKVSK